MRSPRGYYSPSNENPRYNKSSSFQNHDIFDDSDPEMDLRKSEVVPAAAYNLGQSDTEIASLDASKISEAFEESSTGSFYSNEMNNTPMSKTLARNSNIIALRQQRKFWNEEKGGFWEVEAGNSVTARTSRTFLMIMIIVGLVFAVLVLVLEDIPGYREGGTGSNNQGQVNDTASPTISLTLAPSPRPSLSPSVSPSPLPTKLASERPTGTPTRGPTESPTRNPTEAPTRNPTDAPTRNPTEAPSRAPTVNEIVASLSAQCNGNARFSSCASGKQLFHCNRGVESSFVCDQGEVCICRIGTLITFNGNSADGRPYCSQRRNAQDDDDDDVCEFSDDD